ncbi:MAG: SprB repeat-containing protein, partial [Flavobacteriales bacterium]|nr:SprB repeat-containing protein [Flavobacteriales bacterium]
MKTISLSYILIVFTILLSTQVMAQPANDDCSSAQAIGNLPVPAACPSGIGGTLNIAGTLVGATSGNPYDYQNACSGLGGPNMGVPANDVWYTFVATGLEAVIDITSTFANPNVAVYPGVCGNFGGGVGGCAVGIGGSVSLSVEQMTIGETYYLQVSGNVGQTGTFNMDISNNIGCEDCLNASTVTVNPQPVNGMYLPGQTVDFCYKIDQWTQTNTNWLHGVQMDFGSGWDVTTLTTTAPAACQGSGTWAYYPAGITATLGTASTADDVAWPPGFYFNTGGDGNPGNNYGDDCQGIIGAGTWEFCISITVNSICSPGSDLSVTFNTSGDGESGGWDDLGCSFDPTYFVNAVGACCPPNMSSTPSCSNSATGSATATPDGVFAPYDFVWEDATNTVISTTNGVAGANTISNVSPGTYTVIITDVNLCEVSDTVVVGSVTTALNITDPAPVCEPNTVDITAASVTTGSTAGSTFTYFTDAVATITYGTPTAATDTVYYIVATANGCTDTAAVNVMVIDMPVANAGIDDTTCTLTYNLNATLSLGTSTGSWTGSTPAGIIFTNAASATTVATAPSAGSYELYWEEDNTNGCTDVDTVVISFSNLSYTTTLIQPTCGNSNGTITVNAIDGLTPYQYSNDSALTFQALDSFPNLAQGSYDVVVVDALGCIQTSDEVLIDSNSPVIDSLSLTQPLCNGDLNGEVVVHATGGGTPYQYSIDAGGLQPDSTFAGLAGATPYLFTVEDAVGCTDTMSIVLIDPVLLVLDSAIGTDVVCNGDDNGTINLYAQGGTGTLEYSIDNEATYGTASSFTDLAPATYLVWVKDANGCTDSTQVLIQEPVVLSIPNVVDSVVCFGESNGQITVTPLGGIEPYSYFWTTSLGVDSIETGLAAGNVTVTVTDANMCSQDSTFTVFEPAQFTYTTDSQNANCNQPDGWATVIGFAGGTGAYTYDWGAGPTANDTLFNLIPGNYSVTIADANSCDTAITITVGNNLGVVLDSLSLMQPLCSGDLNGEVVVHATGGVTSYQFSVNSGVLQPDSLFTGITGATSYLF